MWLRFKPYLTVCSILLLINSVNCQEPLVEISQGILRGKIGTNRDGGIFYSFQNIPYAQPPLNELRFKAPVAADGWEDIRDATTDLPSCPQFSGIIFFGQEDCLYLNVYTPDLPNEEAALKPVMVFIHGGGFTGGSAQSLSLGPEFLLTKDIVLVVLNYRIGLLDNYFMSNNYNYFRQSSTIQLQVPGNAGMKDQVLALQWVQDNVARFGGDPDDVTIFGESAGAMSVHLQMLSPLSAGLFRRAIAQSGAALTSPLLSERNNGVLVAEQLGIQTEDWSEMLASLREASVEDIITATTILGIATSPVIEQPSNEPAFLSSDPIDIIQYGNYNHVPLIIGVTDAEGLLFQWMSLLASGENLLIEDFSEFVPSHFEITPGSEEEAAVSQKIKEFYYGDTEPSREDITAAVDLNTDFLFAFPAYRSVLEHLRTLSEPIYFYVFSAETDLNFMKQIEPRLREFPGAAHADDLGYLFQNEHTPTVIESGSAEDLAWRRVVDLWTNFAIFGHPTPDDSDGFVWDAVDEDTFNFVNIATDVTYSDVNPKRENMQFWYDLYEEYYPERS